LIIVNCNFLNKFIDYSFITKYQYFTIFAKQQLCSIMFEQNGYLLLVL